MGLDETNQTKLNESIFSAFVKCIVGVMTIFRRMLIEVSSAGYIHMKFEGN
jgi:hypothetical protein